MGTEGEVGGVKCREKEGKGGKWERTKEKRRGKEGRGMT